MRMVILRTEGTLAKKSSGTRIEILISSLALWIERSHSNEDRRATRYAGLLGDEGVPICVGGRSCQAVMLTSRRDTRKLFSSRPVALAGYGVRRRLQEAFAEVAPGLCEASERLRWICTLRE